MIKPLDFGENYELRDSAGNLVAYLLPAKEFEGRAGALNGAPPAAESAAEQRCKELLSECDRLRAQLKEVSEERNIYSKMVGTLLCKYEPIPTDEEIFACLGQKPTFEELLDELKTEMTAKESGHA